MRRLPRRLRQGLIDNGYEELPLTGAHALALADLPWSYPKRNAE